MLCRLCLIDDSNYQKLEGAICDMLKAVLRKKYMQISGPVLCTRCVKKVENAFAFKTTSLRTQKILSLYGGSNTKVVYVRDNKLCVTSKSDTSVKLCKTCLRLIEHNFCLNLLGRYDIIDVMKVYIPEVGIDDKETSLMCYKCFDNFRIFSEVISLNSSCENAITRHCNEKGITDMEQITLDYLIEPKDEDTTDDCNIIKLLEGNDLLNLQNEFESNNTSNIMRDSEKRIIKKIIEEDVDLFYREKPDFDLDDTIYEENGMDSDHGNAFFGVQSRQLLSDFEEDLQYKNLRRSVEEPSLRLSFETEESSLSPGALSDRNFYECEETQDDGKKDDREVSSPNPFIFFNDYAQNDERCACAESTDASSGIAQQKPKKKWCDKCKWKKVLGYGYETMPNSNINNNNNSNNRSSSGDTNALMKKPKKDGKRKCRKAYGIEFKELWCTQCRWKKACTRFGNSKAVSRR